MSDCLVCPVKTVIGDYVEQKVANPAAVKTKKEVVQRPAPVVAAAGAALDVPFSEIFDPTALTWSTLSKSTVAAAPAQRVRGPRTCSAASPGRR